MSCLDSFAPELQLNDPGNISLSFYRFPRDKVHNLDTDQEGILVLRQLGSQKMSKLSLRDKRPHMLAEEIIPVDTENPVSIYHYSSPILYFFLIDNHFICRTIKVHLSWEDITSS